MAELASWWYDYPDTRTMSGGRAAEMLVVDLSALSKPELHRLLAAARRHAESSLTAELVAELGIREGGLRQPPSAPAAARRLSAAVPVGLTMAAAAVTLAIWGRIPTASEPTPAAPRAMVARSQTPNLRVIAIAEPPRTIAETSSAPMVRTAEPPIALPHRTPPLPATPPNPCYAERTPADRLVCGYPKLGAQQRRLREAYVQALAAGARAEELDAEQMEWKAARDGISDRERLAEAYADRILALEEAARAARASEPLV